MSEPSELSPDARSLVEQGRVADAPRASDKERIKGRLAAELGAGAFAVAALSSALPSVASGTSVLAAPATAARGLWRHGLVKVAGAVSALGALGALYVGAVSWTPTKAPAHAYAPVVSPPPESPASEERAMPEAVAVADSLAPAPQRDVPSALRAAPEVQAEASPPQVAAPEAARVAVETQRGPRAVAARRAPAETSPASTLSAELALLATAQRALREHQPQRALAVAQQHASQFATGSLGEERRGIEALAHCQLGEPRHPSVAAFLDEAKSSPLAARVRRECAPR